MLGWFKRRGGVAAPQSGSDYRHVDSRDKAEAMFNRGELKKLFLLPAEFGGSDVPHNVVYVPDFAVELKTRIDLNTIIPLAHEGKVTRYKATPQYEGKSVVPSVIQIAATDPGGFEGSIAIWGSAVQKQEPAMQRSESVVDRPEFKPAPTAVEGLKPEDFVQAYIADYENWNNFSNQEANLDPSSGLDAAESAYATLMKKFCLPGQEHQPIAFGSNSAHDNERETILGTEVLADICVVKTIHTEVSGGLTMTNNYEYYLKNVDARWYLTSVLYVDHDGKYEGL